MSQYHPENTKTGDYNTQRPLSGSLVSIRAVVLAFAMNKQTLTSQWYICTFMYVRGVCKLKTVEIWAVPHPPSLSTAIHLMYVQGLYSYPFYPVMN